MATKRSQRKASAELQQTFAFRIKGIEAVYSIHGRDTKADETEFEEYYHPRIDAVCEFATNLNGRPTTLTLIASRDDLGKSYRAGAPIGHLSMRGDRSEFLGTTPFDVELALPQAIALGTLRFVTLTGDPSSATQLGFARFRSNGILIRRITKDMVTARIWEFQPRPLYERA